MNGLYLDEDLFKKVLVIRHHYLPLHLHTGTLPYYRFTQAKKSLKFPLKIVKLFNWTDVEMENMKDNRHLLILVTSLIMGTQAGNSFGSTFIAGNYMGSGISSTFIVTPKSSSTFILLTSCASSDDVTLVQLYEVGTTVQLCNIAVPFLISAS